MTPPDHRAARLIVLAGWLAVLAAGIVIGRALGL
jgi:hypothetical protein